MSAPWSFWQGGLGLAGVALLHWLLLGRLPAVSGRITQLIDRLRRRSVDEELLAELERATASAFPGAAPVALPAARRSGLAHLVFLAAIVAGAGIAHLVAPGPPVELPSLAVLLVGGVLVGIGTRMAGGCTSGHGLSGVSRLQPGSVAAIAATFAGGIATAMLLGAL